MTFMNSWDSTATITQLNRAVGSTTSEQIIWLWSSSPPSQEEWLQCCSPSPSLEEWLQWKWSNCILFGTEENILWMEFFQIVLATAAWGRHREEFKVVVQCNNTGTVPVVN